MESQQWNSAHKIEMLFPKNYLCQEGYSFLSKARFAKNDFVHKGLTPSYEESHSTLMSIILLVEVASKINEVDFDRANLDKNLSDNLTHCIPQTLIPNKMKRILSM
ncbi:hypothetical protein [Cronobacter sakazakii]|uniref:hypothetical protein n=1 Tax=Cronobacter sakazakii TaxID=28141 RepID=UPI0015C53A87|nr:hypothetical protein [Cronobacter sakazakii]EMA8632506.1 hypothetical protein [Cronobacter sakazakii]